MHRLEHFGLLGAHRIGIERYRRLHRRHGDELEDMVRHHVAQRACDFVEARAGFHTHGFGHGDLHMVDAVAVPDRFEQPVGEAQRHDVLHRLLPEEVIDAVNLFFLKLLEHARVQLFGGLQIVAERLLDHDAPPVLAVFLHQSGFAQRVHHRSKEAIRHRQIEEGVSVRLAFQCRQLVLDIAVSLILGEIADDVVHRIGERLPHRLVDLLLGGLAFAFGQAFQEVVKLFAPLLGGAIVVIDADEREVLRQLAGAREIVKCRHDKPLGEIAMCAEQHHGAVRRRLGTVRHDVGLSAMP